MTPRLFGIPNCDTVKKARAFLAQWGVACEFHDFKKLGVPPRRLGAWVDAVGWERLLNRKGTTWRQLDEPVRQGVLDAASACELIKQLPPSVFEKLEFQLKGAMPPKGGNMALSDADVKSAVDYMVAQAK